MLVRLTFVLGAAALAVGVITAVADAPALGVVAGLLGAGAAWVGSAAANTAHDEAAALVARSREEVARLELQASEVSEQRAAELDSLRDPGEAPQPDQGSAEPGADEAGQPITDPETGLFAADYFQVTLQARVSAARRHLRPVAVVLFEIAEGVSDGLARPADPALVSAQLRQTLREADTACRLGEGRFGLVLEDTPENGAVWTAERVRRALASALPGATLWAGVSCYPAHAFDGPELERRASVALESAKEWRQDRIEVATTADT